MNPSPCRIVAVCGALLAGCGSTVAPVADASVDVAPLSLCPASEPAEGAPCTVSELQCEYGADPRRECRDVAACVGTVWRIQTPASGGRLPWCASVPAAACPATLAAASGQACGAQGAACAYAGLQCECTNCMAFPVGRCDGSPVWQCDRAATAPGCPAASPRFGERCAQESLECEYGCNSPSGAVACMGGAWRRGSFRDCPISLRSAKQDIAYLSAAEAEALSGQVMSTRLATWRYALPSMDTRRRRLGFILDDQPGSFAVDPEHSQVDLYGYVSLLVATVQTQDRQIRALTQRLQALESHHTPRAPRR